MNRLTSFLFSILFIFQLSLFGFSQEEWNGSDLRFMQCFVENNGQTNPMKGEKVLFTAHFDHSTYYFVKNGFFLVKREKQNVSISKPRISQEKANANSVEKNEDKEVKYNTSTFSFMLGSSNENQNIFGDELAPYTFSYGVFSNSKEPHTIKANAYSKLIYKNVYSGIDLVFEFPKDKVGLKYYFVLKPGSNPSSIQINFPNSKIEKLNNNQVKLNTDIGVLFDQIDSVYLANNGKKIECAYTVNKNQIGFDLKFDIVKEKTIIDPWIHDSVSNSFYRVYDVDYDSDYNVYALYEIDFYNPCLIKFSPNGDPLWVYTPIFDIGYHGDFAIDRATNNIFLVEGFNPSGARVVKIDENTNQLAFFPGNSLFAEMWRISYSNCTNQAVIAGGGTSTPTYQTCFLDSDLNNMTMVQYVVTNNCCHDVNMLAVDNFGYCYQVTNKSSVADGLFENELVKLPLPTLLPMEYHVPTNYNIEECYTNAFYGPGSEWENGYNGITTIDNVVFTYDSYYLKKWNGLDGSLILTHEMANEPPTEWPLIYWGGIAVDECKNLFVGYKTNVLEFDSLFNLINTFNFSDTITDVVLGLNNTLYISGYHFVAALPLGGTSTCSYNYIDIDAQIIESNCDEKGSAVLSINGGSPPYDILWNTIPAQTGVEVSNLPPGEYIVTVNDSKCKSYKVTDTIQIGGSILLNDLFETLEPTNVFSPNGDQANEMYFPFENYLSIIAHAGFSEYSFSIVNRWGNILFQTNDFFEGWNGTNVHGISATEGVYYWKLEVKSECDEEIQVLNGFLHLLR